MKKSMLLAHRAAKRLLGPLLWRETYRCLTLPWKQAQAAAASAGPAVAVEVRQLPRAELRQYSRDPGYEISQRFLEGVAERDDLCFGAFVEGNLASYRFFAREPTAIDAHLRFHFPMHWIYAYKAFTHPLWRGKRLHRELFLRSVPQLRQWRKDSLEPHGVVTLVMSDNPASATALGRVGFSPCDSFSVIRIGSRPRWVSPPTDAAKGFYIESKEAP